MQTRVIRPIVRGDDVIVPSKPDPGRSADDSLTEVYDSLLLPILLLLSTGVSAAVFLPFTV